MQIQMKNLKIFFSNILKEPGLVFFDVFILRIVLFLEFLLKNLALSRKVSKNTKNSQELDYQIYIFQATTACLNVSSPFHNCEGIRKEYSKLITEYQNNSTKKTIKP